MPSRKNNPILSMRMRSPHKLRRVKDEPEMISTANSTTTLGALLRRRRLELKHRQVHVGQVLGVGQSTVAKYERGDRIGADRLAAVADYLGMDFTEVLSIYHGFGGYAAPTEEESEAPLEHQVETLTQVVQDLSAQLASLNSLLEANEAARTVSAST